MKVKYKKGTLCVRCGIERADLKKEYTPCSVYGKNYGRHLYNDIDLKIDTHTITPELEERSKIEKI